jgi:tetratricopeptide (TPR) repeat protein
MRGEAEAFARFEEAAALLRDAPPSRAKAYVLSSLSRFLTIEEENEEAIRVGLEALAMADDLAVPELRAHALAGIGRARTRIGDRRGLTDLEESIAVSKAVNSLEVVRGSANLGNAFVEAGELDRAFELYEQGREAARRFGDADRILWFEGERLYESYWRGLWDEAVGLADSLVAQVEAGSPNAIEQDARFVRGRIRLARGDRPGALDDSAFALDLGRRGGYPEMLVPALALRARVLHEAGRPDEAAPLADEIFSLWPERCPSSYWLADLVPGVIAVGRARRFLEAAGRVRTTSRWLDAATAAVEGDLARAAGLYHAIGSLPDEALARLHDARALVESASRHAAEAQLTRALGMLRRLDAAAYVGEGESLLALPG